MEIRDASCELDTLHTIWKTVLPCGNAVAPTSCLQWSEEGQLLIITSETLTILTPAIGYVDAPEEYGAHFSTSIHVSKELEHEKVQGTGNEECATLTAPLQRCDIWVTAAWSPRGMGPHASRSDEAQHLAYTYTCLAWGTGNQHGLLAVGTRGGDLLVWRAPRRKSEAWQCVTSYRLKDGLLQVVWGEGGMVVHTVQSMLLLHYKHDTLSVQQEIPWLASVSMLSWDRSQVRIVSPYGLYRWDTHQDQARIEKRELNAPYATGSIGAYVVLNNGTLQNWDHDRAMHTSWQFHPQPVWGVAQAGQNLVATLVSISTGARDPDSPSSLPRISELFDEKQSVPILAWRSVLFYVMQSTDLMEAFKCLTDHLQSVVLTPLLPRCEQLIDDQALSYKQWKQPTAAVLSLRWCSAWLCRNYSMEHTASKIESRPSQDQLNLNVTGVQQLANEVAAIAGATAAIEAKQKGSYAKRLAAHLILLAESPTPMLKGVSEYLRFLAAYLHPDTKAWKSCSIDLGEKCAACQAPVPFTLDQYTKCSAGHVFGRFDNLTQNDVLQPMRYFMQKIP
ncbi:hypothetical protein MYAM1_002120 [Malassezia yamatoensis]|uniref:Transcription factor IIIC 90kDa subunit N-terminal domain-containing protein n=1 Tax=Malassezia yamatoensis TaxID=253288 RepID=A0AAJ5YT96_9BASI|nr:hypothetical protein MYAM1_002120 [Malassezia yamatoensis]